jgi:hypothetical protein
MDENNCVIIGYCGVTETCEHICSPENPCTNEAKDGDPCCDAIIICDQDINSPNCGGCMWEQSGEPANECFQCEDLVCQCPENPDGPPGGGPPTPGGGELPPSPPPSPPSPPPGGPGDLPPEEPPWEPKPDDPVDPGDPKEEPPVIGPPKPNPNPPDPCEEADILEETINKPETEEICDCDDCGTETKYSCYNNECVENRYGKYNSLLDCLKILCDNSGVCNVDDQFFIPKG